MQKQKKTVNQKMLKQDENILVVKRAYLFGKSSWFGMQKPKDDSFVQTILSRKEFLPRSLMEHDQTYKQIIPYLIFNYQDTYFLMQRRSKSSEQRLRSKYSLGIGGHIRQEDIKNADVASWARREFHEEVDYKGDLSIEFLGVLNDDSNDVGKVHIGFVYLLKGDNPDICVKQELQSGTLMTLQECANYYDAMENWTQIAFDFLQKT